MNLIMCNQFISIRCESYRLQMPKPPDITIFSTCPCFQLKIQKVSFSVERGMLIGRFKIAHWWFLLMLPVRRKKLIGSHITSWHWQLLTVTLRYIVLGTGAPTFLTRILTTHLHYLSYLYLLDDDYMAWQANCMYQSNATISLVTESSVHN